MTNDTQRQGKLSRKELQSIFFGLNDKDLKTLYACSEIKGLASGEVLMKEGNAGKTVYIILEGELKIMKDINGGRPRQVADLHSGDWVGEITFSKKVLRTTSAIASIPSVVMSINDATLSSLNAKSQIFFLKKFNDLANERTSQLASNEKELNSLNRRLIDRIYSERFKSSIDYNGSEMVRGIIKKIPTLPSFSSTLLIQLVQKNISLREAGDLIKQDPSLVAVVLKAVNSSYYGFRQKISDVNHALVLIGFSKIYQLIVAEGVQRTMPNTPDFKALQSHSVAISHIAFGLSMTSRIGNPSEIATIALLHDLGRGVILLLKKQNSSLGILIDSMDHARLGTCLLKEWGLPDMLTRCLEFQSYPELLPPDMIPMEVRDNVVILHLAHLCFNLFEGKSDSVLSDIFLAEYMKFLGQGQLGLGQFVRKSLLPTLAKGFEAYPIPFRKLLKNYVDQEVVREPDRSSGN